MARVKPLDPLYVLNLIYVEFLQERSNGAKPEDDHTYERLASDYIRLNESRLLEGLAWYGSEMLMKVDGLNFKAWAEPLLGYRLVKLPLYVSKPTEKLSASLPVLEKWV